MNKKGFTLVELLAVMILIAILLMVSFPIVLNAVKRTKSGITSATTAILQNAADTCISDGKCSQCGGNALSCTIAVSYLIDNNYITNGMLGDVVNNTYTLTLTKTNNNFTITNIDTLSTTIVCNPSEGTAGLVTYGVGSLPVKGADEANFALGKEYKCDPGDGKVRTFYVVKNDVASNTVDLILAINYGGMVTQSLATSQYLNVLITNNIWKNADNIYMPSANLVSSLLGVSDFSATGSSYPVSISYPNVNLNCPVGSCSENVSTYVGGTGTTTCYWTSTNYSSGEAWYVSSNTLAHQANSVSSNCGFRPVITVRKIRFSNVANEW